MAMTAEQRDAKIPRQQAVGTLGMAAEFVKAGDDITPATKRGKIVHPCYPAYYLYGHGIELTLKAFLVSEGTTTRKLMSIGHDLKRALKAASAHEKFVNVALTEKEAAVLNLMNDYYSVKEFEYLFTGAKRLPLIADLQALANRLVTSIKPIVTRAVRAYIRAESA